MFESSRKPNYQLMTEEIRRFVSGPDPEMLERSMLKEGSYPKINIITPSFNQAEFLERTILSVLNQGYPNLEYIIIDGGSTDGSVEIIKKYEPYLHYWVSEPDSGQADAINKGLRLATGDWLGFQNSDDLFLPGAFETFAEEIKKNEDTELIYGNIVHIDGADRITDIQFTGPSHLWLHLAQGIQFHNQATLWKRSLLERTGYLSTDLRFCLDFEFFTRLVAMKAKMSHIDRFLGAFRHHLTAKSSTIVDVARKEHMETVHRYGGHMFNRLQPVSLMLAKSYKALWYIAHGKAWYVLRHAT